MRTVYADIENIARTLRITVPADKSGRISVVKSDARIVAVDQDELEERNLKNFIEHVCSIKWDYSNDNSILSPTVTLTIHFHEDCLEREFKFKSSGGYYSRLSDLSDDLALIERNLSAYIGDDQYNVDGALELPRPDFAEIDSGSIGNNFNDGLADREFKYEVLCNLSDLD